MVQLTRSRVDGPRHGRARSAVLRGQQMDRCEGIVGHPPRHDLAELLQRQAHLLALEERVHTRV